MPVIGFLSSRSSYDSANIVAALRRGLNETGILEGKNLIIEYRWADGRYEQLSSLAADLVGRKRREFITLIGGATAWPLVARAQKPALPVIGFLCSGSSESANPRVAAVLRG